MLHASRLSTTPTRNLITYTYRAVNQKKKTTKTNFYLKRVDVDKEKAKEPPIYNQTMQKFVCCCIISNIICSLDKNIAFEFRQKK